MAAPVLITGAAGFAGRHLIDLLASGGRPLIAWHRPGGSAPYERPGVAWEAVDLLDRAEVRAAVSRARPEVVYHCAGEAHVGRAWEQTYSALALNVLGTHHLVDALADTGQASRVLVPGSATIYAPSPEPLAEAHTIRPTSPYALSKLAQELAAAGRPEAVAPLLARAFNHFGPGQSPLFSTASFARRIAEVEAGAQPAEVRVGNLDARRDMTDVRDTVRAYVAIAEGGVPGRVYNVCSGRAVAIGELLDMLLSRARVAIPVVRDPALYRREDHPLVLGDPARLRSELGWRAEIPLEQSIDDVLAYWRSRVPASPRGR